MICNECGVIYQYDSPGEEGWNKFYSLSYRKIYEGDDQPTTKSISKQEKRAVVYADMLQTTGIKFHSHLDIGSSAGKLLKKIKEIYPLQFQYGVEPDKAYKDQSIKDGLNVVSALGEIEQLQAQFDLITCCHVLEHLPDPSSFLAKVYSMMHDQSILFIEVPNGEGNIFAMEFAHPLVFTLNSLSSLLNRNGFRITASSIHGKPTHDHPACKNYITLMAMKTVKTSVAEQQPIHKWQLRLRALRNTNWQEHAAVYYLKFPYRIIKFLNGKYAIPD